jgi:hypothetical protein
MIFGTSVLVKIYKTLNVDKFETRNIIGLNNFLFLGR